MYAQMFVNLPRTVAMRRLADAGAAFPKIVPAICYVNRQTFDESMPISLVRLTIDISTRPQTIRILTKFLDQLHEKRGYQSVHSLVLHCDHVHDFNTIQPLLSTCGALRRLELHISGMVGICKSGLALPARQFALHPKETLRGDFESAGLSRIPSLRILVLHCNYRHFYLSMVRCTKEKLFQYVVDATSIAKSSQRVCQSF